MDRTEFQKQLLLERISSNRDLARLEAQALRHGVGGILQIVEVGKQLIQPLGAVAGVAAASLSKKPGKATGAVGLAALIPVALTVAKLVSSLGKRRAARAETEPTPDADVAAAEPENSPASGSDEGA